MSAQLRAYATAVEADTQDQADAGRAVEWLRGRWRAFVALEPQILDLQHRAATAAYAAQQRNPPDLRTAALGKETIERLGELGQRHLRAVDSMRAIASKVPGLSGLGALPLVPVAYIGTVLALAAMVTWIFSRVGAEERIVRLLEHGQLTPEEAQRLLEQTDDPDASDSLLSFLKVVVGVGVAYGVAKAVGVIR